MSKRFITSGSFNRLQSRPPILRSEVAAKSPTVRGKTLIKRSVEGLLLAERDRRIAEARQRGEQVYRWGYAVRKCWTTLWGSLEQVRVPRLRGWKEIGLVERYERHGSYAEKFGETACWLGIQEVLTAPQSPRQNPLVDRFIGSIRRECLDHVIAFIEAGLRRVLKEYFEYYESGRTHLSLDKDAPVSRPVQPPSLGEVIEIPQVGGLHHLYTRKAV
jgi:integrase-like protein